MITRSRTARMLSERDSSVSAVRADSRFLQGKDQPATPVGPGGRRNGDAATTPDRVRAALQRVLDLSQGIPLDQVRHINVDAFDEWIVHQYGKGPFPVVVIGSTSGAALHLAAALQAPFLPQTTLCAVRDLATHGDDAVGAMNTLAPTTRLIADNNPRLAVYHVHDPARDRPAREAMAAMRLKRLRLGRPYERFLEHHLAPGGTVLQVECTRQGHTRTVGERAYFQYGRLGDGLGGGPAGARAPDPDGQRPEAEWGFDAQLGKDLAWFTQRHDHPVRRLVCAEPQDQSPFVADLHRWWYRRLGLPANRLLVESTARWDPLVVLRAALAPFWLRRDLESDYAALRAYLESVDPYDDIYLRLPSQRGADPAAVPARRWEELLAQHARRHAALADPALADPALAVAGPLPFPEPLTIADVDRFVAEAPPRYPLRWE